MLTRVTISGADDGVDPQDLSLLSKRFPFVEWGILFSVSREGTPRYPSKTWVTRLLAETMRKEEDWLSAAPRGHSLPTRPMYLSAHFCGQLVRDLAAGSTVEIRRLSPLFRRMQVNSQTFDEVIGAIGVAFGATSRMRELIFQARSDADLDRAEALIKAKSMRHLTGILFDPSGGRGIENKNWPSPPAEANVGYAGGISAKNVTHVIQALENSHGPSLFWIDMESGVREEDKFDLHLVEEVLIQAAKRVPKELGGVLEA